MIEVEGVNFKGVVFDPNNRNSRFIYSQEIIDRELSKFVEKIKNGTALGRFNPQGLCEYSEINYEKKAFEVTNLARNENGSWVVEGKTLKNFYGNMLNSMLVEDVRLELILTGFGTADENNVVRDDYTLISIDIMPEGTKETNYAV